MADASITPVDQIEVVASMDNWELLIDFVQRQADDALAQGKKSYGLLLASEELLSNIIRENEAEAEAAVSGSLPVRVRIAAQRRQSQGEHWFDLVISDNGTPFDPQLESLEPPAVEVPIQERSVGGLGLFLVKTSVDQVSYCWEEGRNTYCLSSRLEAH
ncbi:MAG: ATP-binding protein [Prochlorococcaceae cyanobacterium]|jgi:serine/threonine-protein kinase RsbW